MSKRSESLRRRITRMVQNEITRGMSEDEIVGALEVVKCNVAIAAASVNAASHLKTRTNHGKNGTNHGKNGTNHGKNGTNHGNN